MLVLPAASRGEFLIFSTVGTVTQSGQIGAVNTDGSGLHTLVAGSATGPERFGGLAVDPVNGYIYSGNFSTIFRTNLDGSNRTTLVQVGGVGSYVGAVALDMDHGKIYYSVANAVPTQLFSANLDGTGARLVYSQNSGNIEGVAVDPVHGKLYFAAGNGIDIANLDGSGLSVFKSLTNGESPFDVHVDPIGGKLYWDQQSADFTQRTIRSANLDGTGPITDILSGSPGLINNGFAFDPVSGKLYYSLVSNTSPFPVLGLYQANADGSGQRQVISGPVGPGAYNYIAVVRPVPEPASVALMCVGVIATLAYRRDRPGAQ